MAIGNATALTGEERVWKLVCIGFPRSRMKRIHSRLWQAFDVGLRIATGISARRTAVLTNEFEVEFVMKALRGSVAVAVSVSVMCKESNPNRHIFRSRSHENFGVTGRTRNNWGSKTKFLSDDLWCADFKGEFRLGNGQYCYPLNVTDQASSCLLLC
jgi:hypothetical protein